MPDEVLACWSPELAYAVGLITADGCLDRNYHLVNFTSCDRELIDLYCACLNLPHDLHIKVEHSQKRTWRTRYVVGLSDLVYRTFLENVGLVPAKSKVLGPLALPDRVFPDFLRGCFDGDGCWYVLRRHPREYLYAHLSSASPRFLIWIRETVHRLTTLEGGISGVILRYGGNKAISLGKWMYYSSDVPCLSRKRIIWERFAK